MDRCDLVALTIYISRYQGGLNETTETLKASSRAKGRKVAPKYRDPDTGDTWSGRGRKPRWLEAKIEAGYTLEDLKV